MRHIFSILIIILFSSVNSDAQWNSEYDYFSFSAGVSHNFGVFHDEGATTNAYVTNTGLEQLISENTFDFTYKPAINAGIYYHHDLKNDNVGLTTGIEYQNYAFKSKFLTDISEQTLYETSSFRTLSLPVFIKYGKKFHEPQRYVFAGAKLNCHLTGKLFYEYDYGHSTYDLEKDEYTKLSPSFFIGFNYKFLNFRIEYLHTTPTVENPIIVSNLSENRGLAKSIFILNTNIHIPLNSWTSRPPYRIETWIRRLFR